MKRIGLALGGGGVRGLAHVLVLEALDEMGLSPSIIAGCSIGAIIGALYASGLSGKTIRKQISEHIISKDDTWRDVLKKKSGLFKWVESFELEHGRGGILKADRVLSFLLAGIRKHTFEELAIPLVVIAADYWAAEEIVIEKGELLPAIKASMSIPGIFAPVSIAGRLLIDGGVVDLVPYEHIMDHCDISIAVNVAHDRVPGARAIPTAWELVSGTFDLMQTATLSDKMRRRKPDIYIHPQIQNVAMLDFSKVESVMRQSQPAINDMKLLLAQKLG